MKSIWSSVTVIGDLDNVDQILLCSVWLAPFSITFCAGLAIFLFRRRDLRKWKPLFWIFRICVQQGFGNDEQQLWGIVSLVFLHLCLETRAFRANLFDKLDPDSFLVPPGKWHTCSRAGPVATPFPSSGSLSCRTSSFRILSASNSISTWRVQSSFHFFNWSLVIPSAYWFANL